MHEGTFADAIEKLMQKDSRYHAEAYFFLREALDFTSQTLKKPAKGEQRHVSGKELLEGLRLFAVQEFGPMALTVLKTWGITRTQHFGDIVFNMVDAGILGKTDKDTPADFADVYDFHDAFVKPFLPARPLEELVSAHPAGTNKPPIRKKTN